MNNNNKDKKQRPVFEIFGGEDNLKQLIKSGGSSIKELAKAVDKYTMNDPPNEKLKQKLSNAIAKVQVAHPTSAIWPAVQMKLQMWDNPSLRRMMFKYCASEQDFSECLNFLVKRLERLNLNFVQNNNFSESNSIVRQKMSIFFDELNEDITDDNIATDEDIDRIIEQNQVNNFSQKTINFANKKKVKETENYIIWDKKTDLSTLSPKELVRIKILRDHKIVESKKSFLRWLFGKNAIGTSVEDLIQFYLEEDKVLLSPMASINKWNDHVKYADSSFKQIGKENIAVEFVLSKTGNIVPIIYSLDPSMTDKAYFCQPDKDFAQSFKRLQYFYDHDQFETVFKQIFSNSYVNMVRFDKEFVSLPGLAKLIMSTGFIIIGPDARVKTQKDLEFTIYHELGHQIFNQPDPKLNKVLNQDILGKLREDFKLTYQNSCNELFADLNALKETNITDVKEYIDMLERTCNERVENSGKGYYRLVLNPRYYLDCHELARNYILMNFKELSKKGFQFPPHLASTYDKMTI